MHAISALSKCYTIEFSVGYYLQFYHPLIQGLDNCDKCLS